MIDPNGIPPSSAGHSMGQRKMMPNPARWRRLRVAILDRDGWRCTNPECGRAGRLEVDHIQPLEKGGAMYDPANLQTLCRTCHIAKTAAQNRKPAPADVQEWRDFMGYS